MPAFVYAIILLVSLRFARGEYRDQWGLLLRLVWHGGHPPACYEPGVELGGGNWLVTATSAGALTRQLMSRNEFTLSMVVASHDSSQVRPARIVSLSLDCGERNFTLGQQGRDLVFRLRTPRAGRNGTHPTLVAPDVFDSDQPRQIVIGYDGSRRSIFVDGDRHQSRLEGVLSGVGAAFLRYWRETLPYAKRPVVCPS
ncbi:MAG: hypothetical protein A2Z18_02420 [Armatimonadetes bacterium RBG_16_58_9]|nr:MAG: hypothetical protein A2Z18_02420 [Armatimonadetes bacterium RBG_16_58_9]